MAQALEETNQNEPNQEVVEHLNRSIRITQHFHNDKCQNATVERDFMDDPGIVHIPCELCCAQINLDDWDTHFKQCSEAEQERIQHITRRADNALIPCEYCSKEFIFRDLSFHMENCAENERQRVKTLTRDAEHALIPCEYCNVPISIEEWTTHTNECAENERRKTGRTTNAVEYDLIPCEYCDGIFAAQYLEEHQTECRKKQLTSASTFQGDVFSGSHSFPHTWNKSSPYNLSRYTLEPSSEEYKYVADNFHKSLPSNVIVEIERIQNRRWYRQYDAHKDDFIERYGVSTEQWLFHGCKSQSVDAIINDCFNRSHAVRYAAGQGIYFATDAAISLSYTQADVDNIRHMFMARVLVGRTTQGNQSTRVCPSGYDTTGGGTVFVTYHDAQAYGEYLISFR
ncbi:hypothetical protein I4U23_023831 [Adineta vaga]|nr:hypothetical protein I4U23_023831 [Adineta vaga]